MLMPVDKKSKDEKRENLILTKFWALKNISFLFTSTVLIHSRSGNKFPSVHILALRMKQEVKREKKKSE